ncbi:NAD(P)/FAD-dependent oxidoreductase [Coleofasciculus sp. FACHB-712]|uniref:NAD(P)/FAD-dependent oxidoreductase n=1 Tax=Cyanophyceae TaxID=3028117 RepID=UPI001687C236|nr:MULTISPECIES: NAD(P)/FAD-dependent oxidoreductase [unclassified Coleofasciculus]MBD1839034.1 NAD(P)/FAD-dependent oxidoreductase [Coleofasciculus sp. FACHB-501]MBD1901185.1 NAD(P)/FAD-dependent oxidoreductase [Coleofasciculus sp. FACHB-125]MBD1942747.1 NAD(P)/FAD-dependent oxidoreductase [Coleofasciculus sp. FACHB-712]MBD2086772.1 NAD(P)/FAD-dependent oxidoreductase [Coleofasciculus sp. FACHB-542]
MIVQPLKVVVIGGGAAGFFGAITCAETYPQAQVILLEAGRQPLSKVRISGGGRCNVTHACFDPAGLVQYYPRGGKALRGAFSRFQAKDTVVWFSDRGVQLKTEPDGRMFPITDSSETIVDCLFEAARASGVQIRRGTPVDKIFRQVTSLNQPLDTGFEIQLKSGEILKCDRILLATGSNPQGYRWAKTLGHTIEPPVPSLFTFTISDPRLQDLAGVSVESARLRLGVGKTQLEQIGPLLITHWGLSGPAALKLSAWAARMLHDCNYRTTLQINWLPQYNPEKLREMLLAVKSQLPQRAISTSCPLPLPRRLWQSLIAAVGISGEQRWAELSNKVLNQLIQELSEGKYQIQGKGVFKEEFVTCGGVNLKEVNFKTMESRICPGLYFAGEILDIDGVTGGFNFQSAWTTAYLAGQAMGNEEIKN